MAVYMRNSNCPCARCRAHGLIGAGILVTLGVLFLLDTNRILDFSQTWPVLFLVIGALVFLSHSASTENHIEPYAPPAVTNPQPPAWTSNNPPPPPAPWTDSAPPPPVPPEQNSQAKP